MSPVLRAVLTAGLAVVAPPAAFLMAGWGWATALLWCAVPLGLAGIRLGAGVGVPVLVHDPLVLFSLSLWGVMGVASIVTAGRMRRDAPAPWIAALVLAALYMVAARAVVVLPTRYVDRLDVRSAGMAPQLLPGDAVLAGAEPFIGEVKVGDVVVLRVLQQDPTAPPEGYRWIKRVVATAGQRVALHGGRLYIDGHKVKRQESAHRWLPSFADGCALVEEEAVLERIGDRWITVLPGTSEAGGDRPAVVVPEGHVYVLGDHRDRSMDSRRIGPVPIGAIEARVLGVASPVTTRPCPRFTLDRLGSRP